jgi:hypothetical protein
MQSCSLNALRVVINPHSHRTKSLPKTESVMPGRTRASNRASNSDTVGRFDDFLGAFKVTTWVVLISKVHLHYVSIKR